MSLRLIRRALASLVIASSVSAALPAVADATTHTAPTTHAATATHVVHPHTSWAWKGWLNAFQVGPVDWPAMNSTSIYVASRSGTCPQLTAYPISSFPAGSSAYDLPSSNQSQFMTPSLRAWTKQITNNCGTGVINSSSVWGVAATDSYVYLEYLTGAGAKYLAVFNASTGALLSNTNVGLNFTSLNTGIFTDGTYAYGYTYTSGNLSRLIRYDSTGAVSYLDFSEGWVSASYGNGILYSVGSSTIARVDASTFTKLSSLTMPTVSGVNCNNAKTVADANYIFVSCAPSSGIYSDGTTLQLSATDGSLVHTFTNTPTGGAMALLNGNVYLATDDTATNWCQCGSLAIYNEATDAVVQDMSLSPSDPGGQGIFQGGLMTNGSIIISTSQQVFSLLGDALVPPAPRQVYGFGGDGRLSVSAYVNAYQGGNKVKSVTFVASPGGASCTVDTSQSDLSNFGSSGSTPSCYITGLTNGNSYTVTAYSTNDIGSGPSTDAAGPYTPIGAPGQVTSLTISSIDSTNVTFTWSPPSVLNGSTVTGYTVTGMSGSVCTINLMSTPSAPLTCTAARTAFAFGPSQYVINVMTQSTGGTSMTSQSSSWPVAPQINSISVAMASSGLSFMVPSMPTGAQNLTGLTVHFSLNSGETCDAPVQSQNPPMQAMGTCQITGLTASTAYTVTASVTNAIGTATYSGTVTTPATVFHGAKSPSFSQVGSKWVGTWTQSTDSPTLIAVVVGQVIDATGATVGSCMATADRITGVVPSTCTARFYGPSTPAGPLYLSGLTTQWSFAVTNQVGATSWAAFASAGVSAAPSAPSNPSATAGNGQATVSWSAPSGGGSASSYTVTASPGGATCTVNAPATTCTVTGLTNGTSYTFSIVATNSDGDSSAATTSAVTPSTTPGSVSGITTSGGPTSATVSWTAPTDNGGSPITSYTVTASPGGATCTVDLVANPSAALSCTVTGLTNGTSYTFTVTPTNANGSGTQSSPSNSVTPNNSAPGAPTNVTATAGDGSATVSWTAPASDGGAAIDGYIVTANPGGLTCTAVAPATTCTISGLTNGTSYTFSVVATNNVGNSSSSDPSGSVTPASGPSAPDRVQVTPGDKVATVNWVAPTTGPAPMRYTVTVGGTDKSCTISLVLHPSAALQCTFTGLTNGQTYSFTVTGFSSGGASAYDAVKATLSPSPAKPSAPRLTTFRGTTTGVATLTWKVSGSNGGSAITRYIAYVSGPRFAKSCSVNVAANANAALTCSVSGLKPRVYYTYRVVAVNAIGTSKPISARRAIDTKIRIATFAVGKTTMWSGLYRQAYLTAFYIKKFKFTSVTITGYANFGGSRPATLAYTQARALTVANYLNRVLSSMHVTGVTVTAVGNGTRLVGRSSKLNRSVSALLSYK